MRHPPHRLGRLRLRASLVCSVLLAGQAAFAQTEVPLHARVNELLQAVQTGPAGVAASDAEFVRRTSLDLVGTIPSALEMRAFLADTQPDKRRRWIEQQIADPRFALHWAELIDVMLMERRADLYVPHADWLKYLQTSLQANKPWNQLARELLTADGTDPALRPAAKFFLDRNAEPHTLTRDVGRIFFGVDLQCAQCHDHPSVDHYAQADYYGLYAFVNRGVLFKDESQNNMAFMAEMSEGAADYESVFTKDASRSRPRFPGSVELDEPHFALGDEYVVAPADKVRPVPKHSRRALLAKVTEGGNPAFDRNFPNRVWAILFGRGLVHPVDWNHPHNPPTHPEVLDAITQAFVASGYDLRTLVRELALTDAYQRSIDLPTGRQARFAEAEAEIARLEQLLAELDQQSQAAAEHITTTYDQTQATRKAIVAPEQAHQQAAQAGLALKKPWEAAVAAVTKSEADATQKQSVVTTLTAATEPAKVAATVLPSDAEVVQAAKVFEARLTTATAELAALQQAVTQQKAAAADAAAKWQAGVTATEAAFAAYTSQTQAWEAAKQQWVAARNAAMVIDQQREALAKRIERWKASATVAAHITTQTAAEQAIAPAQNQLQEAQAAVAQQVEALTALKAQLEQSVKQLQATEQQRAVAQGDLDAQRAKAKPVADAVAAVNVALTTLPGDAELTDVAARLKTRSEPLDAAVKTAEVAYNERTTAYQTASGVHQTALQQVAQGEAELATRQQLVATRQAAFDQANAQAETTRVATAAAWDRVTQYWEMELISRIEKPLTPEQMANTVMTATGVLEPQRQAADAEIEKTVPKASVEADPVKLAQRQYQVEQLVRERMRGNLNAFIAVYGAGSGQPQDQFFATADQALFVSNGPVVRTWVAPYGSNLIARLLPLEDPAALASELYLSVLTREPRPEEVALVTTYLAGRAADRGPAVQELIWALLTSAEFRFNI